jgi:predicted TIM-barrel fold metal-dependent hydrolase
MTSALSYAIGWDAHAHVIGDPREFPLTPGRGYTPDPASLEDYLAMLDRHGIARGVLVQPSVYGHDHRCLLDALDRAAGRLRGIAVPSPDATTQDFEEMHERGVRAIRCNLINPRGLSPATVAAWQPALRAMGWHAEFHISVDQFAGWEDLVQSFDIPVVIDHMGRPTPGRLDPKSPALAKLIEFVRTGQCFVKLSAPYRLARHSTQRDGGWSDVTPLARAFLEANPSACLWGTDWPHVDTSPAVDTSHVIAALDDWRGGRWTRRQVTREAAERLFA